MLYAALVCSAVARGTVESIDSSAAVKDHDVVRVIDSFGGLTLPFDPGKVAFFGQPVAVVVAKTLEAAAHGASVVKVRYNPPLKSVISTRRRPRHDPDNVKRITPEAIPTVPYTAPTWCQTGNTRSCVTTTIRWSCRQPSPAGRATG